MSEIKKLAHAGAFESGDVLVTVEPGEGLALHVKSPLRFEDAIRAAVLEVLEQENVTNAVVTIEDRGAMDWILRARLLCAIGRGKEL